MRYLAFGVEDIAEFTGTGGADLEAGGVASGPGALDAEVTFFHDTICPRAIAQVGHVGVDLILGNGGGGEVEAAGEVRAGRLAITATDAPVVIDDSDAVLLLPCGIDGANFDAGGILTLMALDGHVEEALLGNGLGLVIMIAAFEVEGAVGHLEHADVLDFRCSRHVVLGDAGVDTFAASDAAGEVEAINELDPVHGFVVGDVRAQLVLFLDVFSNPFEHLLHFGGVQFLVVFLEELIDGAEIGEFAEWGETCGEGGESSGDGTGAAQEAASVHGSRGGGLGAIA